MIFKKTTLAATLLASLAFISGCSTLNEPKLTHSEVQAKLKKDFPRLPSDVSVSNSDMPGILEITTGNNTLYTNENGDYLIVGDIIIPEKQISLKDVKIAKARGNIYAELPKNDAVQVKFGNGEREISVFYDVDCPYCKEFEKVIYSFSPNELNLTVNYYLLPLDIHPKAYDTTLAILCSTNPSEGVKKYTFENFIPATDAAKKEECKPQLTRIIDFAKQKSINGTPNIVTPDNHVQPGYVPKEQFLNFLNEHASKK